LEHYDKKTKIIEEKLKAYNTNKISKKENEIKNKNTNNLIKILNGVIKSPIKDQKNLNSTFLTANLDFDENMETIDDKTTQRISNPNLFSEMNIENDYDKY